MTNRNSTYQAASVPPGKRPGSIVVGLVTDPDLPTDIANRLRKQLPRILHGSVSGQIHWDVEVQSEALPLDDEGNLEVWKHSSRIKAEKDWDYLVCLTELTRRRGDQLLISDVDLSHDIALISLPALGAIRLRHRTRDAIVRVIRVMTDDDPEPDRQAASPRKPMRLAGRMQAPIRQETADDESGTSSYLALSGVRAAMRLLFGMVRINRPWRLVPSLSSAIAAAATAAAFGVFYSSIWNMADAMSAARLTSISFIAVVAMMTWLIVYNNLWLRPSRPDQRKEAALYNGSTVLTLAIGVACAYVILFVLTTLGALTVIPSSYLHTTLGHPVTWVDYLGLAWLASSLGIFAGALGSSFESDEAIRQATYGKREQERHAKQ